MYRFPEPQSADSTASSSTLRRQPALPLTEHVVLPGDTIAGIERRYQLLPGALARYNPFLSWLPLRPGTRLRLTAGPVLPQALRQGSPPPAPLPAPQLPPPPYASLEAYAAAHQLAYNFQTQQVGQVKPGGAAPPALGSLSQQYESGRNGPGTVSTGKGDHGGVSYGLYQFASKFKKPEAFLQHEGQAWAAEFKGLTSGTAAFTTVWKEVARREPEAFAAAQHRYVERVYFRHNAALIKKRTGYDVLSRPRAVQNAVWSTAVQHGEDTRLVVRILEQHQATPLSDEELLGLIYAERGRSDKAGNLVHFSSSSAAFQKELKKRFTGELAKALAQLRAAE